MKKFILLIAVFFSVIVSAQVNVELLSHFNPYPSSGYNDIWGYVDPNGNEYALLGVGTGTSIINVTDPSNPVQAAFIPGPPSIWRDLKVHSHYAYVVTEGTTTGKGLQIIDLSGLPSTAVLVNTVDDYFERAHNIFIDNGYAFVIGTDGGGGMHILDLADPVNPVRTAYYSASNYIHDVYVWNDTVVACAENKYDLIDITDKFNPFKISGSGSSTPPGIYAHSGWMTEDKRYFIGTEEFNTVDITVWDIQDRSTWDLVVPTWQMPTGSTVHNLFVKGNYAHISYYTDGYVILDISDPTHPIFAGQYDTEEAWGCYPYLPSGNILISDMQTGLYVLQFTPGDLPPTITYQPIANVLNNNDVNIMADIFDNNNVVAANLHYRTTFSGNTSNWNVVTDINGPTNDTFEFIVPGQPFQTLVEYYLAAVDDSDRVTTLPAGGDGIDPLGETPPPTFFSYLVLNPGLPVIDSFTPAGDTTIEKGETIHFEVTSHDTSGLDISYQWFKNGVYGGNQNFYAYRNLFNPPPAVDSVRVRISNGYYAAEKNWFVTVLLPTEVNDISPELTYSLKQNFPNPFNPSTDIKFSIPQSEFVNLTVYNLIGQKVAVLINENKLKGNYTYRFDASDLPAGVYAAKISAGNYNQTIKMIYLK